LTRFFLMKNWTLGVVSSIRSFSYFSSSSFKEGMLFFSFSIFFALCMTDSLNFFISGSIAMICVFISASKIAIKFFNFFSPK